MVVLDQLRIPLVGLAPDETVEAVVAQSEGPFLARRRHVERIDRDVVILAYPESAPPGIAKNVSDAAVFVRDMTVIAGKAGCRFGDRAITVLMMITTCQKA